VYQVLDANDHVLVAVSGGVDSLSLLKLFILRQKIIQIKSKSGKLRVLYECFPMAYIVE
jgi:PP-loop superfamily ATP-utilizing enzyme